MFPQDGGAHKLVWGCKGDGGSKLCMLCLNLLAQNSKAVDEDGANLLVCNLIREHQLIPATDADIKGSFNRLAMHRLTDSATEFARRQQAIGFNYQPHGMMNDDVLTDIVCPSPQYCHDWMHCIFANGIFDLIVFLFLREVKKTVHRSGQCLGTM